MIAVDTNLLVYAHRGGVPEHLPARNAITRATQQYGIGVAVPTIAEFWCVVTHPTCVGGPSTTQQARAFLDNLMAAGMTTWLPTHGFGSRLAAIASDLGVTGARIFDLQIALTAFEAGARQIWTHDARFKTVPGLLVFDPLT